MSRGRKHKEYLYRAHVMGGSTLVPADRARAVLTDLHKRMSYGAIARALGHSTSSYVKSIEQGRVKRTTPEREAAILALVGYRSTDPTDATHVCTLGAGRRCRALHAIGWTWVAIAAEAGVTVKRIEETAYSKWEVMEARHDAAIRAAYDRLCMTTPSSESLHVRGAITSARKRAARYEWPPPLAWDDIDNPNEQPDLLGDADTDAYDEVVVLRWLDGDRLPTTPAERAEIARRWHASGRSLTSLRNRSGWKVERYWTASKGAA